MPVEVLYDPRGAEVSVETGEGIVRRIDGVGTRRDDGSYRNYRVTLEATHFRADYEVTGFVEGGTAIHRQAIEALANETPRPYEVQVGRKKGIPVEIPIAQVKSTPTAKHDITRILARLGDVVSAEVKPLSATPPAAAAGGVAPDALLAVLTEILASVKTGNTEAIDALSASAVALGCTREPMAGFVAAARTLRPARAAEPKPNPRVAEAKQWEDDNTDGSINVGSYRAQAGIAITELAVAMLAGRADAAALRAPLTAALMDCANTIQSRLTGKVARPADPSHTRARGLLRLVLDQRPLPADLRAKATRDAFFTSVVDDAVEIGAQGLALAYGSDRAAEHLGSSTPATPSPPTGGPAAAAPAPGDADFVAPTTDDVETFTALLDQTGLGKPAGAAWLLARFGTAWITQVHRPALLTALAGITTAEQLRDRLAADLDAAAA